MSYTERAREWLAAAYGTPSTPRHYITFVDSTRLEEPLSWAAELDAKTAECERLRRDIQGRDKPAADALEQAGVSGFLDIAEGIRELAAHRDSHVADANRLAERVDQLEAQLDDIHAIDGPMMAKDSTIHDLEHRVAELEAENDRLRADRSICDSLADGERIRRLEAECDRLRRESGPVLGNVCAIRRKSDGYWWECSSEHGAGWNDKRIRQAWTRRQAGVEVTRMIAAGTEAAGNLEVVELVPESGPVADAEIEAWESEALQQPLPERRWFAVSEAQIKEAIALMRRPRGGGWDALRDLRQRAEWFFVDDRLKILLDSAGRAYNAACENHSAWLLGCIDRLLTSAPAEPERAAGSKRSEGLDALRSLRSRIRDGSEAAPWVIAEINRLIASAPDPLGLGGGPKE